MIESGQHHPFEETLEGVSSFGIKPGLTVTRELLRQLGDPQEDLAVVHVAGTNGKGSFCAMLESCLRQAGYKTGLFTSPHMMYYNERFRLAGEMAEDEVLLALLEETAAAAERTAAVLGRGPTQFEYLTAMAFLWFARAKAEVVILEAGMGGRFDATNIVRQPLLTVITNVALDHEQYLGDTLAAIAGEKAGIIKAGAPLICGAEGEAAQVIRTAFAGVQAQGPAKEPTQEPALIWPLEDCAWSGAEIGLTAQKIHLTTPHDTYPDLHLPLSGRHQRRNLACVVRAWEELQHCLPKLRGASPVLTKVALYEGLAAVAWPCRLELVQNAPAVILDGAHNPDGIRSLAAWLQLQRPNFRQVLLVMGMLEDKDRLLAAGHLDGLVSRVIITRPLSHRAGDWQALAQGFKALGPSQVSYQEDCHQALAEALAEADAADLVLCTGSFYLVGELRKKWKKQDMFSPSGS